MLEAVWLRTRDLPEGVVDQDVEAVVQAVRTRRRRPA